MEKVEKETNKIIEKLSKTEENIKEKLNLPPYHFIELCIIFINYCEELTISRDDFLIAHSQITKDEEDEDATNDEFCTKIFNIISNNKSSAPIHALFAYLKSISISEKLSTEILFKILDREEKGNIEFDNVETLISNLEEYLDVKEDWNDFIESYKGKKLTMRNLSQGDFINRISKLFDMASQKISELTKKSVDKYCEDEESEKNNIKNNNFNKSNNSKEEDKKSKSKNSNIIKDKEEKEDKDDKENSDQSSSNVSSSKVFSKKSEKNENDNDNEKENKSNNKENVEIENDKDTQAIVPYDSMNNNNDNNINNNGINLDEVNFDDSLFEKIFDRKKELKIHQIKNTSLLYDITLEEFLFEFQKYEKTFFDKNQFINIFCEIIQQKTSDVFKGPMLRYSLSLLYQFIDVEKKNKLSYYEILGPIIVLTKAKTEERLSMIFSYDGPELVAIVSGILSLYLNSDVIKDFNILSEIFIKTCSQMDLKQSQNIFKWIFNKDEEKNIDKNFDFLVEEENIEEDVEKNILDGKIISQLNSVFQQTKFGGVNQFAIIDITNKLLMKYSLLGQMNIHHLKSLVDELLNIKYGEQKSKEKIKARIEFLSFVEKFINFGKTELVDVTLLHSLFILIFSGSTMEKVRSIFIIHDINESDLLKSFDFGIYLAHMFHFLLTEMCFEDNNLSNYLGKHIADVISQGKEGVSFMQIMEFFENIDFDIPSY